MRWLDAIFGVRGLSAFAPYQPVAGTEEKENTQTMNSTGKSKAYVGGGRSTEQWMAAKLFSGLGALFYWTVPGIDLNVGQSELPVLLFFVNRP
jgi:hypothetical protein